MVVKRRDGVHAAGERWYSLFSVSLPLRHNHLRHQHQCHTYPPSRSRRLNGTRPPGQTPCNHHVCGLIGRAIELSDPSRFSNFIFFPSLAGFALTPPSNHDASSLRPFKTPKLQAPAFRFIHLTAGQRRATRPREPPATANSTSEAVQLSRQPYSACCPLGASNALFAEHGRLRASVTRGSCVFGFLLVNISKVGRVNRLSAPFVSHIALSICFSACLSRSCLVSLQVTLSSVAGPTSLL